MEFARFDGIRKIEGYNLITNTLKQLAILNRKESFHSTVQVAGPQICAPEVNFRLTSVFEVIHAAVLQKPSDDTPHANVLAHA